MLRGEGGVEEGGGEVVSASPPKETRGRTTRMLQAARRFRKRLTLTRHKSE